MNQHEPRQGEHDLRELIETLRQIEASDADAPTRRTCRELVKKLTGNLPDLGSESKVRVLPRVGMWLPRLGRCA